MPGNAVGFFFLIMFNVIFRSLGSGTGIIVEATGNPIVYNECLKLFGVNSVIALLSVTGGNFKTDIDVAKLNYDMVLNNKFISFYISTK